MPLSQQQKLRQGSCVSKIDWISKASRISALSPHQHYTNERQPVAAYVYLYSCFHSRSFLLGSYPGPEIKSDLQWEYEWPKCQTNIQEGEAQSPEHRQRQKSTSDSSEVIMKCLLLSHEGLSHTILHFSLVLKMKRKNTAELHGWRLTHISTAWHRPPANMWSAGYAFRKSRDWETWSLSFFLFLFDSLQPRAYHLSIRTHPKLSG